MVREAEEDQADAEDDCGDRNDPRESTDGAAQDERESGGERSDADRAHEEAEGVRAAVKDLGGEDRHEHHEGPSHEAEQREEQKDGADGNESGNVGPAFFQLSESGGSVRVAHRCGARAS